MNCIASTTLLLFALGSTGLGGARAADDPALREALARLVDCNGEQGIVAGVIEDGRARTAACGGTGVAGRKAGADTVFEIGSITKVFTGVLLADMALQKEVQLDQPFAKLLPGTRMPKSKRPITLLDLATHTSGLPRNPPGLPETPEAYSSYTRAQLLGSLERIALQAEPGTRAAYSNYQALLGHALSARARKPFAALMQERVFEPLGLVKTSLAAPAAGATHASVGHDRVGERAPPFADPAFEAAGAMRSTLNDLLRFAAAHWGEDGTRIGRALREARIPRRPGENPGHSWGLGWGVDPAAGTLGHEGGTWGYSSYLYVDPGKRRAVVVLANFAGTEALGLGAHLVDAARFPAPRATIGRSVYSAWRAGGLAGALDRHSELRAERDDGDFRDGDLDAVGYRLLRAGRTDDALAIFVLNAVHFPNSANVHDSLGEAYLAAGRTEEAVASYARALRIAVDERRPAAAAIRQRYEAAVQRAHAEPRAEPPKLTPNASIKW